MSAPDDKTIRFRLKQPFPLLPIALGKVSVVICPMMPERLAKTDPFTQVTEMVGSGPFRFKADERVPGARVVYERFEGYVPRSGGTPEWTSGPKVAHFDRIEWNVIPDAATAMGALQNGEADWWEQPTFDLLPLLRKTSNLVLETLDPTGSPSMLRFNQLFPPFDNAAIRRALLGAVDQADFMTAVAGTDPSGWRDKVGFFPPGSPLASDVGMQALEGPRDLNKVKKDLAAAGYKGEKIVVMVASDFPVLNAMGQVGADMLQQVGMNVDLQVTDWGSVVQRRASRKPPDQGGWSVFFTAFGGVDQYTPAGHLGLRGNGTDGWFGWPTDPKLEELRAAWFAAPDLAAQKKIGEAIQAEAFQSVPYLPLGEYFQPTAHAKSISGVLKGMPLFWNVSKSGVTDGSRWGRTFRSHHKPDGRPRPRGAEHRATTVNEFRPSPGSICWRSRTVHRCPGARRWRLDRGPRPGVARDRNDRRCRGRGPRWPTAASGRRGGRVWGCS